MAQCEWNPVAHEPATGMSDADCQNEATVHVGTTFNLHACQSCSELPEFRRMKKRPLKVPMTNTNPAPLLPCPFCDHALFLISDESVMKPETSAYYSECLNCGWRGPRLKTEVIAIEASNALPRAVVVDVERVPTNSDVGYYVLKTCVGWIKPGGKIRLVGVPNSDLDWAKMVHAAQAVLLADAAALADAEGGNDADT